ncbi:Threonine synthase [Sulfurovum sp. enrichment culture clone C5]|uniref:Threonine synthase n=1 Tax=Sulfurovum sp. enrichment culture clone C5 TaxID=497650 RepID=A0A0S4XR01_9BACT|nr:Threonine synthase [Sulfurovum sp. enrichment culture clone C5]
MQFVETRGNDGKKPSTVTFSEAILSPSGSFGGLYVPTKLPSIDNNFLTKHKNSSYKELAFDFLKLCEIDIDDETIKQALDRYDLYDDASNPVPLSKIEDDCFVSELYHGPTRAFKDMALQPFGYILSSLAKKRNQNYLIMAATSGDTGPATLETFKNQSNVQVVCLYPDGGTSDVQKLQMVTEDAKNLHVFGVVGDFDDTQNALKNLLASDEFNNTLKEKNIELSAANSVNFGRIIFQIIYHIYSYIKLVKSENINLGENIYIVVPSGNFGNALGGYYAKKMGLPIEKILITSNRNNILTDWIKEGSYDLTTRHLIQTISPAMDILKSSNVERILYDKFGDKRTKELMDELSDSGKYHLSNDEIGEIKKDFDASYSSDEECLEVIGEYAKKDYIMDPHTATCIKAYKTLREQKLQTVIYSTAEWTKFSPTVAKALGIDAKEDLKALDMVSKKANLKIPDMVLGLFDKPIIHNKIIDKNSIKDSILTIL